MRKQIKIALMVLFLILPFFGVALYQNGQNIHTMSRGNYFFDKSRHNINIEKISLKFGERNQITLIQNDGFWRVKEADDYFVSPEQMNALVNFINNTTIFRSDKLDKENIDKYIQYPIEIKTFNNKGKILDAVIISPKNENNIYYYASSPDYSYLYQLNGKIAFSPILMDWVQMPFFQLNYNEIQSIESDDFTVYRHFAGDELKSSDTQKSVNPIRRLINNLHFLNATAINHAIHFDLNTFTLKKHYDITLLNGLIYGINIYYGNDEYWVNIQPDVLPLHSKELENQLERLQLLNEGWFFRIDTDKGQIISDFIL